MIGGRAWGVGRGRAVAGIFLVALFAAVRAEADPHIDYILHCQGCHGPNGAGAPGAAPSFRDHVGKFLSVPGGRDYLMRVPGVTQSELSDARTADLLNWLVHEFSPAQVPEDFVPYSAAEVGAHRHSPLTDVNTIRGQLLDAMGGNNGATGH